MNYMFNLVLSVLQKNVEKKICHLHNKLYVTKKDVRMLRGKFVICITNCMQLKNMSLK